MRVFRRRTTVIARGKSNTRATGQYDTSSWMEILSVESIIGIAGRLLQIADGLTADRLGPIRASAELLVRPPIIAVEDKQWVQSCVQDFFG
jgi:hypothetical protein